MSDQVIFTSIFGTAYRVAGEMRLRSSNVPCLAIALAEALAAERAKNESLLGTIHGMALDERQVEQLCGKALGYPRYCDDQKNFPGATEADGVCIGDQVAVTIVHDLVDRFAAERAAREAAEAKLHSCPKCGASCKECQCVDAELSALRSQLATVTAERDEARETNRHLNRRCQEAESKLHQWLGHLQRGCNAVRYEADRLKEWADDNMLRRHMVDAKAKVERYRNAVAKFLNARNHDLCHENRRELAEAFGLFDHMKCDVSPEAFSAGCEEYQRQLYGISPSEAARTALQEQLTAAQQRVERLEKGYAAIKQTLGKAGFWIRGCCCRDRLGEITKAVDAALTESEAT